MAVAAAEAASRMEVGTGTEVAMVAVAVAARAVEAAVETRAVVERVGAESSRPRELVVGEVVYLEVEGLGVVGKEQERAKEVREAEKVAEKEVEGLAEVRVGVAKVEERVGEKQVAAEAVAAMAEAMAVAVMAEVAKAAVATVVARVVAMEARAVLAVARAGA